MIETVNVDELSGALRWIRALRQWAVRRHVDPWAVREALLIALSMDTEASLERGIPREDLARFDDAVNKDVKRWVKENWKP